MPYIKTFKEEGKEEKLEKEIELFKSEKDDDYYIRQLVAKQKGKLNVSSSYYKGNIAEGNWSILEEDSDIKKFDLEEIETELVDTCVSKLGKSIREKDAEYTYVFIPSYYAVKSLILYYIRCTMDAKRIYGLRNAVVRRSSKKSEKFYGGLPFILKYMKIIYTRKFAKDDTIKYDFADLIQKLLDRKLGLEMNNSEDDFINDIIDCINNSYCASYILDKRIKDFKDKKYDYYCIDFKEILENNGELLNYILVDEYKILMHRDVDKDLKLLPKVLKDKAKDKITKTPLHPNNNSPKDSEALKGNLQGWFSQRISIKDRLVYKKDIQEKIVYIAAAYSHYDKAPRRTKSKSSYK